MSTKATLSKRPAPRGKASFSLPFCLAVFLFILPLFYLILAFTLLSWKLSSTGTNHALQNYGSDWPPSLNSAHQRNNATQRIHTPSQSRSRTEYLRYDQVGLRILDDANVNQVPFLSCIPPKYRIPSSVTNVTKFFLDPQNVFPNREYLFDYNPSIVQLPPNERKNRLLSDQVYVASFRVSNQHYCFHPPDRQRMMNGNSKSQDYLGLALLDHDLNVLTSVVVNLKQAGFPAAEDFRLFSLHNQLYISSYDLIVPLWLHHPTGAENTSVPVPIVFGDWKVYVGNRPSCAGCGRPNACGKNLNYFISPSTDSSASLSQNTNNIETQSSVKVEIWPSSPHLIHGVNLSQPCRRRQPPTEVHSTPDTSPLRSFATMEEAMFPKLITSHAESRGIFTRGRGGACCISLAHPVTGAPLMVGIQHSKTPSQGRRSRNGDNHDSTNTIQANHYLSSIYAFEAAAPYRLVAQSGYFCLPFAASTSRATWGVVRATAWRTLQLGNETFPDCPRIHFVSGVTLEESSSGSSSPNVIVAYGVNDCYSRFVKIPQEEILRFLFMDGQSK